MEGRPITIACIESSPSSPHYSRIQLLRLVAAFPNRLRKGPREAKPSESPPSRTDFGKALARRSRASHRLPEQTSERRSRGEAERVAAFPNRLRKGAREAKPSENLPALPGVLGARIL